MHLIINELEREHLKTALEIYRDELNEASEAVTSRRMKVEFETKAEDARYLISRIADLTETDSVGTRDGKIVEFLRAGQKIEAIKYVRSQTTLGLKDAKDYVEKIQSEGGL